MITFKIFNYKCIKINLLLYAKLVLGYLYELFFNFLIKTFTFLKHLIYLHFHNISVKKL